MAISQVLLVCLGFCLLGKQAEGVAVTLALPAGTISVDETIAAGATVTTLTVANTPTAGSINSQPNDGQFVLAHATGIITLGAGFVLDYETATSYVIVVQIENGDPSTASVTATISVTDVTEEFSSSVMSVCLSGTTFSAGASLTTVSAAASTVTGAYTIQSQIPNSGHLSMATTGAISVASGKSINAAVNPIYTVGIRLVATAPAATTTDATLYITFGCTSGAATLMVGSFALLLAMLVAMLQ